MYACLYVHHLSGARGEQKKSFDPLELELQAVVTCLVWVWENKARFSLQEHSSFFNFWTIFPAPQ